MLKMVCTSTLLLFVASFAYAGSSDTEIIDQVLREVVINHVISDDRKIPKKDRAKWEQGFAECIDFESLNNAMRTNVRQALHKYLDEPIDEKNAAWLSEKAVAFYLPKVLGQVAITHLRVQKKKGELPNCGEELKPVPEDTILICTERSKHGIRAYWIDPVSGERPYHYSFEKTDRWRLTELSLPIDEQTLELLARWK